MKATQSKPEVFKAIIATISLTGKAGKSVAANTLLLPRMPGAKLFRVETINESGEAGSNAEIEQLKGREIEKLLKGLSKVESAVVDVGTSNVESFFVGLTQDVGAQNMFDYFVVPVESNAAKVNEFKEFANTVQQLNRLGVEPERIKVVFNKHLVDNDVETEMIRIFNFHERFPIFTLDKRAVIHETELFKALSSAKKGYDEMLTDNTDYWKLLKQTPIEQEKERENIVKMARAQGLVRGVNAELDAVFFALFGVKPAANGGTAAVAEKINVADFE